MKARDVGPFVCLFGAAVTTTLFGTIMVWATWRERPWRQP